jgi:hypothetical protein
MYKLLYLILLLYSSNSFTQTAKDFLINDNEKLNKKLLIDIINESKNYGYNLERNDKGDFIFHDGIYNYFFLEKKITNFNYEEFPQHSVGRIYKKYYFTEENIEEAYAWKIETEISLIEYDNVNYNQINNCFERIISETNRLILNNKFEIEKTSKKLNFKSFLNNNYDIITENDINFDCQKKNNQNCNLQHVYSYGVSFKEIRNENGITNIHFLTYALKDKVISSSMEDVSLLVTNSNNSIDKIKFTIGGIDLRKINNYDLEAMVKFFLNDCKKNNIKVSDVSTLNATFEPLDGDLLALSYGFGDDTAIIIKVDPVKWNNASIVKKWYVIYHELGHDVLNLEHGQGGKMMFNFADKEYAWDDFFQDKNYMMNFIKNKK